jgi:hypothetical protein
MEFVLRHRFSQRHAAVYCWDPWCASSSQENVNFDCSFLAGQGEHSFTDFVCSCGDFVSLFAGKNGLTCVTYL